MITLYGPDREAVASVENPNTRSRIEPLFWVANLSGEHVIEVRGQDAGMRLGKYSISIDALRESSSQDRDRVAAQTAYSYAYSVSRRTLEEAQLNCLPLLEQTAQQWKNLRETEREEENQRDIAKVRRNLGIIYEGGQVQLELFAVVTALDRNALRPHRLRRVAQIPGYGKSPHGSYSTL